MNATISMNNVLNIIHAMALSASNKQWLGERLIDEAKEERRSEEARLTTTANVIMSGPLKGFRRIRKEEISVSPTVAEMFKVSKPLPADFDVKKAYGDYLYEKYK